MPHLKRPSSLKDLALKATISFTQNLCKVAENTTDADYILGLPSPFDQVIAKEALTTLCQKYWPDEYDIKKFTYAFSCFYPMSTQMTKPIRHLDLDIFEFGDEKFKKEARSLLKTHLKCSNFKIITSLKVNQMGTDELVKLIARYCPNLEELEAGKMVTDQAMEYLVGKNVSNEENISPGCFKLKSLGVGNEETEVSEVGTALILKNLKHLEYFSFSNFFGALEVIIEDEDEDDLQNFKEELENGSKLMIKRIEEQSEYGNLDGPVLDLFLKNICPNLESICLCDNQSVSQIAKISQVYKLRYIFLDIEFYDNIRLDVLKHGRFDFLLELKIYLDFIHRDMEDIMIIGNHCKNLVSLEVTANEFTQFEDDRVKGIKTWFRNASPKKPFSHLKKLSLCLNGMEHIRSFPYENFNAAVQIFFITACPNLEELYLSKLAEPEANVIFSYLLKDNPLQQLKKLKLSTRWRKFSSQFEDGIDEEDIKKLIEKLPELKEFNLAYLCGVGPYEYDSLCEFVEEKNLDLILK